jgi:hypothetical protein
MKIYNKFDKPRTAEEYRELSAIKLALIRRSKQQDLQAAYQLEDDIRRVVEGLYVDENVLNIYELVELEYDPKRMTDKFKDTLSLPTQQKIKHNVADYYPYIKAKFMEIEREHPGISDLIYSQVKTYYLKQNIPSLTQQEAFSNVVNWFYTKTKPQTIDAAEIVASFFIQNCEVF